MELIKTICNEYPVVWGHEQYDLVLSFFCAIVWNVTLFRRKTHYKLITPKIRIVLWRWDEDKLMYIGPAGNLLR